MGSADILGRVGKLAGLMRRLAGLPGVPQGRHIAERAVAPYLRADLESVHRDLLDACERMAGIERRLVAIEEHMPAVLNAVVSTNGNARLVRREIENVRGEVVALRVALGQSAPAGAHPD
jgi:hypothetical protein